MFFGTNLSLGVQIDLVGNMISRSYSIDAAIDKIYSTYRHQLSVSNILVKLRCDKRRGGHPDLRS